MLYIQTSCVPVAKLSFCKNKLGNCLVGKLSIGNMSGWENVWLRICRLRICRLILRICRLRKNRIGNLSLGICRLRKTRAEKLSFEKLSEIPHLLGASFIHVELHTCGNFHMDTLIDCDWRRISSLSSFSCKRKEW